MSTFQEYKLAQEKEFEIALRTRKKGLDDCWEYLFVNHNGYGEMHTSTDGNKQKLFIHRAILCLKLGRGIMVGYHALHTCDNPSCANPKHLWEGTKGDNNKDSKMKGRNSYGCHYLEDDPRSKLRGEDIPQIRLRLNSGETLSSIGRSFGVSYVAIRNIRDRKSWSEF